MNILYVNVIEENAEWGAEVFMDRALRTLGHETQCLDFRRHRSELAQRLNKMSRPDAFLLQRGDGFPLPLIRAIRVPRFFWASELVARCRDQDRLLSSGLFEHVFLRTTDCIDAVVERGWLKRNQCSVLMSGFDTDQADVLPDSPRDIDVLFVGSATERRSAILGQLSAALGDRLTVTSAWGLDQSALFKRARIVLNIHAEEFLDVETRVFEVLGAGALLITEKLAADNPFSSTDLVEVISPDEMISSARYYLDHEAERAAIATCGNACARSNHTYLARARQIVEILDSAGEALPANKEWLEKGLRWYAYSGLEALSWVPKVRRASRAARSIVARAWHSLRERTSMRRGTDALA